MKVRKAVIPAAGLGTRFLPAAKAVPKEMLPIVDVPAIQVVVEEAVAAGIEQIVIVNGRHKGSIEEHFDRAYELETILEQRGKSEVVAQLRKISSMAEIISVRQKDPLGLGHAVLCARAAIGDEPFAVLLPDDLFDGEPPGIGQLAAVYEQTGLSSIAVMEVPQEEVCLYGIVGGKLDEQGRIRATELVEKPDPKSAPSRNAVIGRYVLGPAVWKMLQETRPGHGGEIQLTDALGALARGPGLLAVQLKGTRYDVGTRLGFLEANLGYALKRSDLRFGVRQLLKKL